MTWIHWCARRGGMLVALSGVVALLPLGVSARDATSAELWRHIAPSCVERVSAALPAIARLHAAVRAPLAEQQRRLAAWHVTARRSAWLPKFQLGARQLFHDGFDLRSADEVSVSGAGVTIGPRTNTLTEAGRRDISLLASAQWNLSELRYHPDSLPLARAERDLHVLTQHTLERADTAFADYVRWRAVQECADHASVRESLGRAAFEQLQARAVLDALTDDWFSVQLTDLPHKK